MATLGHAPGTRCDGLGPAAILVGLSLNYLNLLPFPPLDGGQLLRNLWPQRWRGSLWLLLALLMAVGLVMSLKYGWTLIAVVIALQWHSLRSRINGQVLAALPPQAANLPIAELDALILAQLQARVPNQSLRERLRQALELRQITRLQPLCLAEGLGVLALWLGVWAWGVHLALNLGR